MALPKSHRLSLRQNRDRLTKSGKTSFGKYFTLVSAEIPEDVDQTKSRFAILLSKKTAALSTDRNRIKRLTSSLLETLLPSIPAKDYLIIPKRQILIEKYSTLEEDIRMLFAN